MKKLFIALKKFHISIFSNITIDYNLLAQLVDQLCKNHHIYPLKKYYGFYTWKNERCVLKYG